MAAAPETAAYGGPARPSRSRAGSNRKRWTLDEIDALLDGIEAYGFGAWKSVTRVGERGVQAAAAWEQCGTPCHVTVYVAAVVVQPMWHDTCSCSRGRGRVGQCFGYA
jgi:hypothetical protein